jgi:hypothetical protein
MESPPVHPWWFFWTDSADEEAACTRRNGVVVALAPEAARRDRDALCFSTFILPFPPGNGHAKLRIP